MLWFEKFTHLLENPRLVILVELGLKSTVVLFAAAILARVLRRRSAACRDVVWITTFLFLGMLPLLNFYIPGWKLPILPRLDAWRQLILSRDEMLPAFECTLVVWVAGSSIVALRGFLAYRAAMRIVRNATPATGSLLLESFGQVAGEMGIHRKVRLLISRSIDVPCSFGYFRPCVLLPPSAASWKTDRLGVVFRHELSHVHRADLLTQLMVSISTSIFWWLPLSWYAARRWLEDRERACDDIVLQSGQRPTDYAMHLLAIAALVGRHSSVRASALMSMAARPFLRLRIQSILETRQRDALSIWASVRIAFPLSVLFILLASVHPVPLLSSTTFPSDFAEQITLKKRHGLRDAKFLFKGDRLITSGSGDSIRFWDPRTGIEVDKWTPYSGQETISVDVAEDHSIIAALSTGGSVVICDAKTKQAVAEFQPPKSCDRIALHPAGTMLAAIGKRGGLFVFRIESAAGCVLLSDPEYDATCCEFSPDGNRIAVGTQQGKICVWQFGVAQRVEEAFQAHDGPIESLVFTPNGGLIVACGRCPEPIATSDAKTEKRRIRIFEPAVGKAVGEVMADVQIRGKCLLDVATDHDLLAIATASSTTLWDLNRRRTWHRVEHKNRATRTTLSCFSVSSDGRYVARIGSDERVEVWDMATKQPTVSTNGSHDDKVVALRILGDGRHILSVGQRGDIKLWNLDTCERVRSFLASPTQLTRSYPGSTQPAVDTVSAWSETRGTQYRASTVQEADECHLRVYMVSDVSLVRSINLHDQRVTALTFSKDEIAGLDNGDAVIWDCTHDTTP